MAVVFDSFKKCVLLRGQVSPEKKTFYHLYVWFHRIPLFWLKFRINPVRLNILRMRRARMNCQLLKRFETATIRIPISSCSLSVRSFTVTIQKTRQTSLVDMCSPTEIFQGSWTWFAMSRIECPVSNIQYSCAKCVELDMIFCWWWILTCLKRSA